MKSVRVNFKQVAIASFKPVLIHYYNNQNKYPRTNALAPSELVQAIHTPPPHKMRIEIVHYLRST
jgi:hypothetical protein